MVFATRAALVIALVVALIVETCGRYLHGAASPPEVNTVVGRYIVLPRRTVPLAQAERRVAVASSLPTMWGNMMVDEEQVPHEALSGIQPRIKCAPQRDASIAASLLCRVR